MTDISFVQRKSKITKKEVVEWNSEPLLNLMYLRNNSALNNMLNYFFALPGKMSSQYPGIVFGKPNLIFKEYESAPGLWIFDFSNGVTICMYSDGFRKNHFKGTSYEIILNKKIDSEDIVNALTSLFNELQKKFKEQFPLEYEKYQRLEKQFNKTKP